MTPDNTKASEEISALREQLDNERHARALYQDEHIALTDKLAEVTKERDAWKASRNALLAATNEATTLLYAQRDEARALLREIERDRKTLPMTAGVTFMASVGSQWFERRDALLNGPSAGAGVNT